MNDDAPKILFYRKQYRRASKAYICPGCQMAIGKGSVYLYEVIKDDCEPKIQVHRSHAYNCWET